MYLRKISPRTTCLYSAASMLLRSASAAFQSLSSKPRFAEVLPFLSAMIARETFLPGAVRYFAQNETSSVSIGTNTKSRRPKKKGPRPHLTFGTGV
jgi:hypothetical protein